MLGIISIPLVPLRESENERSEMTSQLLFGECVEVLEAHDNWLLVQNLSDKYIGWADRKMIQILNEVGKRTILKKKPWCVSNQLLVYKDVNSKLDMILPGGSMIHDFDGIGKNEYDFTLSRSGNYLISDVISGSGLIDFAKKYLNTPYLWGGKTILGIDCSGFVQVVFSIFGIQLPRDASQQVEQGNVIDFLTEVKAGDLAFFENSDGKIIHVGILINSKMIIHASGWVKIDTIDSQGIFSIQMGEYTHKLRVIKRLI